MGSLKVGLSASYLGQVVVDTQHKARFWNEMFCIYLLVWIEWHIFEWFQNKKENDFELPWNIGILLWVKWNTFKCFVSNESMFASLLVVTLLHTRMVWWCLYWVHTLVDCLVGHRLKLKTCILNRMCEFLRMVGVLECLIFFLDSHQEWWECCESVCLPMRLMGSQVGVLWGGLLDGP